MKKEEKECNVLYDLRVKDNRLINGINCYNFEYCGYTKRYSGLRMTVTEGIYSHLKVSGKGGMPPPIA